MRSKREIPAENKSYSALFFILSGLLGLVTLWGFWSEMITRRPWKQIQQEFYQYEYEKTRAALEKIELELPERTSPKKAEPKVLSQLMRNVETAQVTLDEAMQERKFRQSESDAINYKYQHSLHGAKAHGAGERDETVKKWAMKLAEFESAIEGELTAAVLQAETGFAAANKALAQFYQSNSDWENALSTYLIAQKYNSADTEISDSIATVQMELSALKAVKATHEEVARLQEKQDSVSGIKRSFLGSLLENPFHKTRTIVQHYLEEFDYTADRCETCHFSADRSGYETSARETFEVEGDGENKVSYQLEHSRIKPGSESVVIDGFEAEEDEYTLEDNGTITFNDVDVFGEVEIEYETAYRPVLQTHPHRDVLLAKHPIDRFGCTPCHGGQGQALTAKSAHALTHAEYWLTPVLGLDEHTGRISEETKGYMESNCRRCHDGVMMLDAKNPETGEQQDYAPNLTKGLGLFEDLGCHGCHAVEGYSAIETINKVGPSLAKVGSKVQDIAWLENWLKKPEAYMPDTKMPNFFPTAGMSQIVYLKNGGKRIGAVTKTADGIIIKTDDGTEYPYPNSYVTRIVDEVKSIAAYLAQMQDDSLDTVQTYPTSEKAIKAGEETVKTVGCLTCHAVDGLGSDFGPALDSVGAKVTAGYLRQWVTDPQAYDADTAMPSLRLSQTEIDNVVAYLMSLKQPTPVAVSESVGDVDVTEGEVLVRTYGCFGCHEIPGFENESKVGADLGEFGGKTVEEFDFGDTVDVEHSWTGWTLGKITNPRRYQTRRIVSRMPVFQLDEEEAKALAVLLKSFQAAKYPLSYIHQRSEKLNHIDAGRRLVKKYNCSGCHEIEGKGGSYVDVVMAHEGLDAINAKQFSPPTLQSEGAKVYPDWLFEFLKVPSDIRYGLKVRMPTFGLSDDEATTFVKYFSALDDEPFPYETLELPVATRAELRVGKQVFDVLQCISCHPAKGEVIPEGSDKAGRPDLSLAKERLKADWLIDWLKDPQSFQPGTAMPQAWPLVGGQYMPLEGYADDDAEKQIRLVRDYLISLGR